MEAKWEDLRDDAKTRWSRLTDEDIDLVAGRAERLIDRLQLRYGYTRDRARLEAKYFMEEHIPVIEERAEQMVNEVQSQAREHPWHLLVIGILIGFLLGQINMPGQD